MEPNNDVIRLLATVKKILELIIFNSFPRGSVTAIKLSQILPLLTKEGVGGWWLRDWIKSAVLTTPGPSFSKRGEMVLNLMAVTLPRGNAANIFLLLRSKGD